MSAAPRSALTTAPTRLEMLDRMRAAVPSALSPQSTLPHFIDAAKFAMARFRRNVTASCLAVASRTRASKLWCVCVIGFNV